MKKIVGISFLSLGVIQLSAQVYCIPQTQAYCCGYGITSVTLPGITLTSQDGSVGYEDHTPSLSETMEGQSIPVSIQTGGFEPHDTRIWLDANNNGTFEHPAEMVFESLATVNPSGELALPTGTPSNTIMRLRITADFSGGNPLPCTNPTFGQTEDYLLKIIQSGEIPQAIFSALNTYSCNGGVSFTNQSTGNPTSYLWDFGDGNSSTEMSPNHGYTQNGDYDVTLSVYNSLGGDTLTKTDYVHINISETCDTFQMPTAGTLAILYTCDHVLTDNGRGNNYGDNTNGIMSLSPVGAEKVCLKFSEFHFEETFDYLEIYDGPSPASPVMGRYTGNQLPPEVCSSGPSLCLRQVSDDVVNYPGFVAQANCTMMIQDMTGSEIAVFPSPFSDYIRVTFPTDITNARMELFSISGQLVFGTSLDGQSEQVNIPDGVPAGLYCLRIRTDKRVWLQKILKAQ